MWSIFYPYLIKDLVEVDTRIARLIKYIIRLLKLLEPPVCNEM